MKTALIIDDIENARVSLRRDLGDYCEGIDEIFEADGVVSGAKAIKEYDPDIVFLDIQMNDGSGFDLLELLPEIHFKLIFTTSSDEHAIQAFKFSAVDYLLKPIDPSELKEAVKKAAGNNGSLEALRTNMGGKIERLALNSQDKIKVVRVPEIVRCESTGSYTLFFMKGGEQVLVTRTLKEYDSLLSSQGFIRVHQSHLVNLDYVREFVKVDGGYLVLDDRSEIPVASRKKSLVMKVLSEIE